MIVYLSTMLVRLCRLLSLQRFRSGRVLFLPPSTPGNLGDEAIIEPFLERCARNKLFVTVIAYAQPTEWDHLQGIGKVVLIRNLFRSNSTWDKVRFLSQLVRTQYFVVAGADVLDGCYSRFRSLRRIELLFLATCAGVSTHVFGASCNEVPSPDCMDALRSIGTPFEIRARDRHSQCRLMTHLKRFVAFCPDTAFLLQPVGGSPKVERVTNWVKLRRQLGGKVIGVNVCSSHITERSHEYGEQLKSAYVEAIENLISVNAASIVFIPHDLRGNPSDATLCGEVRQRLQSNMLDVTICLEDEFRATEIKFLVAELDVVLTGRMHLAIACLGSGVPVGCISRQGKFAGLLELVEQEDAIISPDDAVSPGRLSKFLKNLLETFPARKIQLEGAIQRIRTITEENLPEFLRSGVLVLYGMYSVSGVSS
jgi:polysaccharide pyruvyl transferase WcaK-like protein